MRERRSRLCSIIQSACSFGGNQDLLETMGLTKNGDDVEGYLTAEEMLKRIKQAL